MTAEPSTLALAPWRILLRAPTRALALACAVALPLLTPAEGRAQDSKLVALAEGLKAKGASALEVAEVISRDHRQDPLQTTLVLRATGYGASDTGAALTRVFRSGPSEVAEAMRSARYRAEETARGLEGAGIRSGQISRALLDGGYPVADVVRTHVSAGRTVRASLSDLRAADVSVSEMTRVFRREYRVGPERLTRDLIDEGYTPEEVVDAVAGEGDVTPEAMVGYLTGAGVEFVAAAAAVLEGMLARTVPVALDLLARLLGLGGIAEASTDQLVRILAVVERTGLSVTEAAARMAGVAGIDTQALADALMETGMSAEEAATAVWGRVGTVTEAAVLWLFARGMDAGEILALTGEWGWDAASTAVFFTRSLVGDAMQCMVTFAGAPVAMVRALVVDGPHPPADLPGIPVKATVRAVAVCVKLGYGQAQVIRAGVRQGLIDAGTGLAWLWSMTPGLPSPSDAQFWLQHLTADEAAEALWAVGATAGEIAEALLAMGFDPASVWTALRDQLGLTAAQIAQHLHDAGLPVDQILGLLTTVAQAPYDTALAIVQALSGAL